MDRETENYMRVTPPLERLAWAAWMRPPLPRLSGGLHRAAAIAPYMAGPCDATSAISSIFPPVGHLITRLRCDHKCKISDSHRIWTHKWTPTPAQNSFMRLDIWELFHNECVNYSLNREASVLTLLQAWPSGTKFLHNFIFTPHSLDSA